MAKQKEFQLKSISPLDGRYYDKTAILGELCSEYALIKYRIVAEILWLQHLCNKDIFPSIPEEDNKKLEALLNNFSLTDALEVKQIETKTNHDVKAVECYIAQTLNNDTLTPLIHFGCTSEEINNIAYALMLKDIRSNVLSTETENLLSRIEKLVKEWKNIPMLSHTHGQPASPTTLGKELAVFHERIRTQLETLMSICIKAKMNGAVGNFNAHHIALPDVNWVLTSNEYIASLDLTPNNLTTQIEPHDWIAEYAHALIRINSILIDFSRDIWMYISMGYLKSNPVSSETGSSTMPHKVNPIDFENAEGNLGISNALLNHLAIKLPASRLQRDLSDSTALRNLGSAFGYFLIATKSIERGLSRIDVNLDKISMDLGHQPEVLAEAIQTVMRAQGIGDAYDQLKIFTRGKRVSIEDLRSFIKTIDIDGKAKKRLLALEVADYIGLAQSLAEKIHSK
jgi:adenylosuccinate lyase